ncbi:zinc ribbon domain-containing protein [Flavitalea flava]
MIYIIGKRNARIGKYVDNEQICYRCKAFEREIKVYRTYVHFCYIPVVPFGPKQIDIRCLNCGDKTNTESLGKKYEKYAKTPFYLYSALFLIVIIGGYWFYWNKNNQKQKIALVANPAIGDVYTLTEEIKNGTTYSFMRISGIEGDSVMTLHSNLEYSGFVSHLAEDDYFVKDDTVVHSRKELKNMLENDEIYSVQRNYEEGDGFNRVK